LDDIDSDIENDGAIKNIYSKYRHECKKI